MDPVNVLAKFEVHSFTRSWDNRGTQKIGQSLDTPTFPFSENFNGDFFRMDPVNVPAKFEGRSFIPIPEIIAIGDLGGGCEPPILGREGRMGSGWYSLKER